VPSSPPRRRRRALGGVQSQAAGHAAADPSAHLQRRSRSRGSSCPSTSTGTLGNDAAVDSHEPSASVETSDSRQTYKVPGLFGQVQPRAPERRRRHEVRDALRSTSRKLTSASPRTRRQSLINVRVCYDPTGRTASAPAPIRRILVVRRACSPRRLPQVSAPTTRSSAILGCCSGSGWRRRSGLRDSKTNSQADLRLVVAAWVRGRRGGDPLDQARRANPTFDVLRNVWPLAAGLYGDVAARRSRTRSAVGAEAVSGRPRSGRNTARTPTDAA